MRDLAEYGSCTLAEDGCTTCGDIAVPVRVIRRTAAGTALCEDRTGRREEIPVAFTPEAAPGDVLLVHAGVAIGRVNTKEEAEAS